MNYVQCYLLTYRSSEGTVREEGILFLHEKYFKTDLVTNLFSTCS